MTPINIVGVIGLLLLLLYIAADMPPAIEWRGESLTLRYSRGLRWIALFAAGAMPLLFTLVVIGNPPKEPGDGWIILGASLLYGALSGYLLRETVGFAVTITANGFECQSGWRRRRFVPWQEITGLSPGTVTKHFILRTRSGYRYHVPMQLVPGLPLLLMAYSVAVVKVQLPAEPGQAVAEKQA